MDYMDFLWVEKYRPKTIDDFVLPEETINHLKKWVEDGHFPHLILYGTYGTGKTSIVKFLLDNIECEVLELNASKENKLDVMRDKVTTFLSRSSLFGLKVVVFHEGENLTTRSQEVLKEEIEIHSDDARVIFTTNHIEKLDGAIADRCLQLKIEPDSPQDVAKRIQYILKNEGIEIPEDQKMNLWELVKEEFPSVRNCIKLVQSYSSNGKIIIGNSSNVGDFKKIMTIISKSNTNNKVNNFYKAREITNSLSYTSLSTFYSYLYKNLNDIFNKEEMFDIITIIAEYNFRSAHDIDLELNIASLIKELIEYKSN